MEEPLSTCNVPRGREAESGYYYEGRHSRHGTLTVTLAASDAGVSDLNRVPGRLVGRHGIREQALLREDEVPLGVACVIEQRVLEQTNSTLHCSTAAYPASSCASS